MADPTNSQNASGPTADVKEEDIDASIEDTINPNPSQPDPMNLDGANDLDANIPPTSGEPRIPAKKDATLREFISKMDDYAPIIPDAVTNYYLALAGLPPPPQTSPHLARLLALATQKFIADIAADAYQYSRIRASNTSSNNPMGGLGVAGAAGAAGSQGAGAAGTAASSKEGQKGAALGVQRPGFGGGGQGGGGQGRTVLTMEDLGMAVGEYGVNVKRSEFYR